MWSRLQAEWASFERRQRWFVLFAMLAGFLIAAEYGITRPASNALFLTHFSAQWFPYIWLATVPLNLLTVALYNRFLPRYGPWKTFVAITAVVIGVNLAAGLVGASFPWVLFFQSAWRDVYVLLMFKQLWSMIHATIPSDRAKYLYGLIFAMGTLGSVTASLVPGFFAVRLGSEQLFYFTLPLYVFLALAYRQANQRSPLNLDSYHQNPTPQQGKASEGFSMIFRSRYLLAVLAIVVLMQVSVGLVEYQFNLSLEREILDKDLRTEYLGRLLSLTNILSGLLQLVGSYLMIQWLGVRKSHIAVPLGLLATSAACLISPSFGLLSFSFLLIKGVDYSLFGVIREMLYIPLQFDEKFRAKAVIDVFAYRTSKAVVSLFVLILQLGWGAQIIPAVRGLSLAIFCVWIGVVWISLQIPRTVKG